uniref:HP domain-containing protein n=1 Tax=Brassica oleracea var. oleracea TaxID=109376 RepID=A0A0D3ALH6_BRAOL
MTFSMRDLDEALQGCGQKSGIEIWRIENFKPVTVPKESHGKFFTGDSYIVLKTAASRSGSLHHDIHYWLGKDSSQDEAGAVAIMTVELDSALGGRAVQYREVQGHETEKFLSYFKPCIIPQEGGVASGFNHVKPEKHQTRLYICKGKHVVRVKEASQLTVPFARSTLNHDDVFILDTESKIFQFSGSNSSIQERAKALEVVQYIKDTYHDGKCDIAAVEDGRLMADTEAGEFWGLFGGFAPLPKKSALRDHQTAESDGLKLSSVEKGQTKPIEAESLQKELLDTNKCYILDCGLELFVWKGRQTSIDQRKSASKAAEELFRSSVRPKSNLVSVMEGFETVMFRSKFDSWPATSAVAEPQHGRGKVAALLQRRGVNVQGLVKTSSSSSKDEPKPYIDGTGNLQVWRINREEKIPLEAAEQSKFYSGDCYIFQYSYPGEDREESLVGTWLGKQSVEEERASAISMASKMVESMKFMPAQGLLLARIYEGKEPIQFFVIMQSFITFKGGLSDAFKKYIVENEVPDSTYDAEGVALFRVQGSGPENMQAIQIEAVSTGLNSYYCYILHGDSTVFTWRGNLTSSDDQELMERMLDLIKPNENTKAQKEGSESEQFWKLLGGKSEYPSQKIKKDGESDPHLFSCTFSNENLKVTEIFNFTQDDLMTEDIFILDCHTEIFVWVGQQVDPKKKPKSLAIGEKFLKHDFLLENLASETPIYIVTEGNEPPFFTRFFTWDSSKSAMHGNSFQKKLAILTNKGKPLVDKPKRRVPVYSSRSSFPDKSQPRSRSMTSTPDRARVRGRSPAFNALAANFENIGTRNQSTPPPMVSPLVRKLYPKSLAPDLTPRSAAFAARTALFEKSRPTPQETPSSLGPAEATNEAEAPKTTEDESMSSIREDSKEEEEEEAEEEGSSLPTFPYERLKTDSEDPPPSDIDLRRREAYMSSAEFKEKLEMTKSEFYKLPKWKQNKLKMAVHLF